MLGKTFKGLTDELLAWQTEQLLAREVRRDGHVVHVRPELVVEIALDGFVRSTRYAGGIAMRFARVRGYRPDKDPAGRGHAGHGSGDLHRRAAADRVSHRSRRRLPVDARRVGVTHRWQGARPGRTTPSERDHRGPRTIDLPGTRLRPRRGTAAAGAGCTTSGGCAPARRSAASDRGPAPSTAASATPRPAAGATPTTSSGGGTATSPRSARCGPPAPARSRAATASNTAAACAALTTSGWS